jgi:hypothetical protein
MLRRIYITEKRLKDSKVMTWRANPVTYVTRFCWAFYSAIHLDSFLL